MLKQLIFYTEDYNDFIKPQKIQRQMVVYTHSSASDGQSNTRLVIQNA